MTDIDTTCISDLPIDPAGGGNNISLLAQETQQNINPPNSYSLDPSTINQIVNGLQQANTSGSTQLQSRDIPQNTSDIVQDPFIQPNYIPTPPNKSDYITEYETNEEIMNNYNKTHNNYNNNNNTDSLDEMYNEIQAPLLLAIIYFLFQLPIFRKTVFDYIPFLFLNDGNYNITGFIFTSCLFGLVFYLLNKVIFHFSTF
jgi:hypothetical protein